MSINEFRINILHRVSSSGYTWQCCLKYTRINLQNLQVKDLFLTLENKISGGISSVLGDRYVKSDDIKKVIYMDATNLYGHSMIQPLPYDGNEMGHGDPDLYIKKIEEFLKSPDDSDIGCFVGVDLKNPDNIKEETKNFPFCPEKKVIH